MHDGRGGAVEIVRRWSCLRRRSLCRRRTPIASATRPAPLGLARGAWRSDEQLEKRPGETFGPRYPPRDADGALNEAIAGRRIHPVGPGESLQRRARRLGLPQKLEHTGPVGEPRDGWQPFASQQAIQTEARAQAQRARKCFHAAWAAIACDECLEHGPSSPRKARQERV